MQFAAKHLSIMAFGLLLLTGCSGWEDRDRIDYPVLSSDGSAIAGVESFWEAKCNIWSSCGVEYTRNYSYKVWTATKPALLEPAKLSPSGNSQRFSGRVDSVVYAKNAAQHYLLVVAYEEAKYRDTFETEIDREPTYSVRQLVLNPAGTTVTTVRELYRGQVARYRSCSENSYSSIDRPLTAHASRDGSQIALAYNRLGCTDVAFEVALFDAGSGAALGQTQLDLPGISANELSTGGATARGWIALSADTPAEAVDTELLTQLQDEDTLYNKGIISEGYQASKTRFQTRRQSLAQRDDNRQIFVVTQTNPFTNAIQGTHLIEVQNQSVSAKKFEGGSGNPIDLGARGTQIGNPDSDGAYYFDVVQRCYDNDCALQYSAKPELSGYFATAADLAAEVVIESEFWKINRYREFIAQKQTGTYAKSFTFTRLDVDARSMKGVIDCLSTISGYGDEYDPNVAMEENTCAKWSDQDDAATSPNWPGDGYDWDEKRFAELRWTFDAAGALYICETQAKTESALATIPVDNASLDNGCNGEAWLTIEEPSRDLDFPEF